MTSTSSQSTNQTSTAPQDINGTTSHPQNTNVGQPYYPHQDFNYNAHFRPYQFPPGYHPPPADYPNSNNFPYPMNNYPPNYGQNLTLNQLLQQNHSTNPPNSNGSKQSSFPNYDAQNPFQYASANNKPNPDENRPGNYPVNYPPQANGQLPRYPLPGPGGGAGGQESNSSGGKGNSTSPNRNTPTPGKMNLSAGGKTGSEDLSTAEKAEKKTDDSSTSASGESSSAEKKTDESAGSRIGSPQASTDKNSSAKTPQSTPSPVPSADNNGPSASSTPAPADRVNSSAVSAKSEQPPSVASSQGPQPPMPPQPAIMPSGFPNGAVNPKMIGNNNYPGGPHGPPMGFFGYPQNGQLPPGMSMPPGPYPPGFHPPNPHHMLPNYQGQGGPMPPHSMINPSAMGQHGQPMFGYPVLPNHPNMPMGQGNNNYPMGPFMHNNSMGPRPPMMPMMPNGPGSNQQPPPMSHNPVASQTCFMKLLEMGNEPDRHAWASHYFKFMDDIGKPVITLPQIVKQTCDLYRLFFAVKERGGILSVVKNKRWKEIATHINININASAGYTLRKNYVKYLIDYECKFERGGSDPAPLVAEVEALSASKKRKQSPAGSIASQEDKNLNQSKNNSFNFPPPSPVGSQSSASSSLQQPPPPPGSLGQISEGTATPPRVSSTGPIMNNGPIKQQQMRQMPRNNYPPQLPPAASAPSTVVHHAPPGTVVNTSMGPNPVNQQNHQLHHQQQQQQEKYSSSVLNNLMKMNQQHHPTSANNQGGKQSQPPPNSLQQQQPSQQIHHQQPPQPQHQIPNTTQGPNHQILKQDPGNTNAKEYDFNHHMDPNIVINNSSNQIHHQRMFKSTPNMTQMVVQQQQQQQHQQQIHQQQAIQRKPTDIFPPGSIEATPIVDSPKKKRLRPRDLPAGSLHATRILNGLRSSLQAELVWSLNVINIMLREDSGSVSQEFLSHFHLPTLVQSLANVWRKSLGLLINRKKFIDEMELPEFLTDSYHTADQRLTEEMNQTPDLSSQINQKLVENDLSEEEFKKFLIKTLSRRNKYPEKHSKSGRLVVLENRETYRAIRSLRAISGEANRKRKFSKIMEDSPFKNKVSLKDYASSFGTCDRVASICDYVINMIDDRPKAQPEVGLEIESIEKKWLYENQSAALKGFLKKGGGDTTCHINFPNLGSRNKLVNPDDTFWDSEILKENQQKTDGDDSGVETIEIPDCPVLSPPQGQKKSARSKTPPPIIKREGKKNLRGTQYCPLKAREEIVFVGNASKPLRPIDDERDQIVNICIAASNAFRNLTFVAPADAFLSSNTSFLFILSQILLLAHRHVDESEDWTCVDGCWDELDFEDDRNWWWIEELREHSLVSLVNISGHLKLVNHNETIVKGILDALLHWIVCKSSQAVDPLPFQRLISPQRLALEALNRLSVHELNVDLLFNLKENESFEENSKIARLFEVLSMNLSMPEDQVIRELSISTMHYLVENSRYHMSGVNCHTNIASQLIVSTSPCVISGLLTFIESTEMTTRRVIEQFGVQALQERPDLMGSSLELVRRAGGLIDKLISNENGRKKVTVIQEQRILDLATSRVLDATVAQMLSSAIQRLPRNTIKYPEVGCEIEKFSMPKLPSMTEIGALIEIANEKLIKMAQEQRKGDSEHSDSRGPTLDTMSSPGSTKTEENLPETLTAEPAQNESTAQNDNDKDLPPPQLSEATTPKSVDNSAESNNNLPSLILA